MRRPSSRGTILPLPRPDGTSYPSRMPKLSTTVDKSSEAFARNAAVNTALVEELRQRVAKAALGGPESSRQRHASRGKLLPRERVERLLDPGSPFL